jgi:hypothetical protein
MQLESRYRVAMVLYVALGVAAWFYFGDTKLAVAGRPVELRLIPVIVLAASALKTLLYRKAEQVRSGK